MKSQPPKKCSTLTLNHHGSNAQFCFQLPYNFWFFLAYIPCKWLQVPNPYMQIMWKYYQRKCVYNTVIWKPGGKQVKITIKNKSTQYNYCSNNIRCKNKVDLWLFVYQLSMNSTMNTYNLGTTNQNPWQLQYSITFKHYRQWMCVVFPQTLNQKVWSPLKTMAPRTAIPNQNRIYNK